MGLEQPYSTPTERALLGGLVTDPKQIGEAAEILRPEDLYHLSHRAIFRALLDLTARGLPVDPPSVVEAIRAEVGDEPAMADVVKLYEVTPTSANVLSHARQLRRYSQVRATRTACLEYLSTTGSCPLEEAALPALGHAVQSAETEAAGTVDVYEAFEADLAERMRRAQAGGASIAVPTGFEGLDEILGGGLEEGLHVIGGWSSMGKSAMALTMILSALGAGFRPRVYSLDMPASEFVVRVCQRHAGVGWKELRTGKISPEQAVRVSRVVDRLKTKGLGLVDRQMTIEELARDAWRWRATTGILFVDTLQCLTTSSRSVRGEYDQVCAVMRGLRELKRRLRVPIVLLAQLKDPPGRREVEGGTPPKPSANEVRGGRVITDDARTVICLWRSSWGKPDGDGCDAEIIVGKNQAGPKADVDCWWDAERCEFVERGARQQGRLP